MLSLLVSTIAFFAASYGLKRYLDRQDIPKGRTRTILVVTLAVAAAYGAALIVHDLVA